MVVVVVVNVDVSGIVLLVMVRHDGHTAVVLWVTSSVVPLTFTPAAAAAATDAGVAVVVSAGVVVVVPAANRTRTAVLAGIAARGTVRLLLRQSKK